MLRSLYDIHTRSGGTGNLISDEGIFENTFEKNYKDIKLSSFYGNEVGFYVSKNN